MRDMDIEQVMQGYERATELVPLLGELGWDAKRSFNGLMSITADGSPLVGESPEVGGLWFAEAVWVKDAPGVAKVLADWMTAGRSQWDTASMDIARFYAVQKTPAYVFGRCFETAKKVYNPAVHPREPYLTGRDLRRGPFWPREKELGGYFMEAAGWERAHGYSANEHLLEKYAERVPQRRNEWDARHFWPVSNAEQLAMSDSVGMVNLSHFAIYDVSGPDAEQLLEYLSVAKVGGGTALGQGVYTHFLDEAGGVHSDLTIIRLSAAEYRVVCGGSTGPRDLMWMRSVRESRGFKAQIADRTEDLVTLGLWGPNARRTLQAVADDPDSTDTRAFPLRGGTVDPHTRTAGMGISHLLRGRAGVGALSIAELRAEPLGSAVRAGRRTRWHRDVRQYAAGWRRACACRTLTCSRSTTCTRQAWREPRSRVMPSTARRPTWPSASARVSPRTCAPSRWKATPMPAAWLVIRWVNGPSSIRPAAKY